ARALGTTQPTVSRRLSALERRIGVKLFERGAAGLSPSKLCAVLIESLDQMEEQAQAGERRSAAGDTGLRGAITVTRLARVGECGWLRGGCLGAVAARFCARHKLVTIDLVNDPRRFNLFRREADVAVRIGMFERDDLVERKVADVSYGLYASPHYLHRYGQPD